MTSSWMPFASRRWASVVVYRVEKWVMARRRAPAAAAMRAVSGAVQCPCSTASSRRSLV